MKVLISFSLIFFLRSNDLYACSSWDCSESINICPTETLDACGFNSYITTSNSSYDNLDIYLEEIYGKSPGKNEPNYYNDDSLETFKRLLNESSLPNAEKENSLKRFESIKGYIPQNQRALKMELGQNTVESFINAVDLFYGEKYKESYELFQKISSTSSGFMAEYSLYLMTRAAHKMAVFNWDGYSDKEANINQEWVDKMTSATESYLQKYPSGTYAKTLEDMKRRIAILKNGSAAFFTLINKQLDEASSQNTPPLVKKERIYELLFEYIYVAAVQKSVNEPRELHPLYWPFFANYLLRESLQTPKETIELFKNGLDSMKEAFKNYPLQWLLSKGAFLYYENDYEGILKLLNDTQIKSYSTESLKARALIKLKRLEEAKTTLLDIKNYELLVYAYYYNNELGKILLSRSKIPFNAHYVQAVVKKLELSQLTSLVKDKDLLPKYLPILEEFVTQKALVKSDWNELSSFKSKKYPLIQASAKKLQKTSDDSKSLLNVIKAQMSSDYFYQDFYNSCGYEAPDTQKVDEKELKIPLTYISDILSRLDPKKSYSFEPMLLSKAIKCFKGSGQNCSMGVYLGDEKFQAIYPESMREGWFKRLQSRYKNSSYAKQTRFFY